MKRTTVQMLMNVLLFVQGVLSFEGDGTFYGAGGAGSAGSCMLERGFNGIEMTVAMNSVQYDGGSVCGKCVRITGQGEGIGMTPILGPFFATVDNECPECKFGDVDLGLQGDGRWRIAWDWIPCQEAKASQSPPHYSLRRHSIV